MTTNGTVIEALEAMARARPERPALAAPAGGRWVETSWSDYRDLVFRAAAGLVRIGVPPATGVAIHSANRPEWATRRCRPSPPTQTAHSGSSGATSSASTTPRPSS